MHIFVELITDLIVQVLFEGICVTTGAALFVALKGFRSRYSDELTQKNYGRNGVTGLVFYLALFTSLWTLKS